MIVIAAALVTGFPPPANITMLLGIRIGLFGYLIHECFAQPVFHFPKISGVVGKPISLRFKVRPWRDNIHVLRSYTLSFRQQIGIKAQLENGSRLRFARCARPQPSGFSSRAQL